MFIPPSLSLHITLFHYTVQVADTTQRLKTLQTDFKVLQELYESLETSKKSLLSQNELQLQNLDSQYKQLEANHAELMAENDSLKERNQITRQQIESFQSALGQSEAELSQMRAIILEKDRFITKLEAKTSTLSLDQQDFEPQNTIDKSAELHNPASIEKIVPTIVLLTSEQESTDSGMIMVCSFG